MIFAYKMKSQTNLKTIKNLDKKINFNRNNFVNYNLIN